MKHEIIIAGPISHEIVEKISLLLEKIAEPDSLTVKIDSNGGSAVAGLALHDMLSTHPCKKEALVLGMCASAATLVAIGCKNISLMPNATWMVHAPSGGLFGTSKQIEEQLVHFRNLEQQVVEIYAKHTGRSEDDIRAEISGDRFYRAAEALSKGWITSIIGGSPATEVKQEAPEAQALVTEGDEGEKKFKLWSSIPEMVAAGIDIFRAPEAREERKATQELAALKSEMEALRQECAAATQSAEALRTELTAMAETREVYAQQHTAATLAHLGRDTAPLPEACSDLPPRSTTREQIERAAEQGGINAAFAAARAAAGFPNP